MATQPQPTPQPAPMPDPGPASPHPQMHDPDAIDPGAPDTWPDKHAEDKAKSKGTDR